MELTPLLVKFTLLQSIFFPLNFSFVFNKRKIWREKICSSKEWIYFAKEFLPLKYFWNSTFSLTDLCTLRVRKIYLSRKLKFVPNYPKWRYYINTYIFSSMVKLKVYRKYFFISEISNFPRKSIKKTSQTGPLIIIFVYKIP